MLKSIFQRIIFNFLDKPSTTFLILTITTGGLLTPFAHFNSQIKGKWTYFIKKREGIVTMANFYDLVLFGDMAGKPIEELSVLLDTVFLPILSNPGNQKGWPQVVADDVVAHVRSFKNAVEQVSF